MTLFEVASGRPGGDTRPQMNERDLDAVQSSTALDPEQVTDTTRTSGAAENARRRDLGDAVDYPASHSVKRDRTGPVLVIIAFGVLGQAVSAVGVEHDTPWASALFWLSLTAMFLAVALRIMHPASGARERVVLTVGLGVGLMASRAVLYPKGFVDFDELLHLNTLRLITESHRLFGVNPNLPVSPYYPGLEIATDAIRSITGLSTHVSGLVVLFAARIVAVTGLIVVLQRISGSNRAACTGALVYFANPQYLFFNSNFSYQSLALPLGVFVLAVLVDHAHQPQAWRTAVAVAVPAMLAVTVTHHLTAAGLAVVLVAWWVLARMFARGRRPNRAVGITAALALAAVPLWAVIPGHVVVEYLTQIINASWHELINQLNGKGSHKLFQDYGGDVTPLWERVLSLGADGTICLLIIPAAWQVRSFFKRRVALGCILVLVAVMYPAIPAGHLTRATAEFSDRLAGFLFVGLGLVLGLAVTHWFRPNNVGRPDLRAPGAAGPVKGSVNRRNRRRLLGTSVGRVLGGVTFAAVFLGSTISGSGPFWNLTPGPFLVSADNRSVDPINLAAARWAAGALPENRRVFTDRVNRLLIAEVGKQYPVTQLADVIDAAPVVFDPVFGAQDLSDLRKTRTEYLEIDRRLSTGLPRVGVYFEEGEPGALQHKHPIALSSLTKFDSVKGVSRVYDNGDDVFYYVGGLLARS